MSSAKQIVGHKEHRDSLLRMSANNTLAHSNLFADPSGIGKRLVAREIAQTILCEDKSASGACLECEACKLFESGNHPDFYLLECESSDFNAEQARDLLYSINLSPYRGKSRVIIFNDADNLSVVVANLLLKTLEEPRKETFFFLIASNPSRLPIPVVSRCQTWRFSRLTNSEVRSQIAGKADLKSVEDLVQLANGSLEHVQDLTSFIPLWQSTKERLQKITSGDTSLALALAAEIAKDKAQIVNSLSMIRLFLRASLKSEPQADKKLLLADGLENTITAQRLITERNLAPLGVLNLCMLGLSGQLPASGRLIADIVI